MPEAPPPPYRMPAEWEPQRGTWLAWPHRRSDWPGKFGPVPWAYAEIVRHLSRFQRVDVLCQDAAQRRRARRAVADAGADTANVSFHVCPNDRGWLRDSGPCFVLAADESLVAVDWRFTAWAKYPDWPLDDRTAGFVAGARGVPTVQPKVRGWRVVLEGGGIDVNGAGVMLTTEECLLSPVQQRNPPMDRDDYEGVFRDYLGCRKTIWLDRGVAGDDTHGHVDDLARFINTSTIVLVQEPDEADENHAPLRENWERLQGATDADGRRLEVVALPMPRPVVFQGQRLPASYANFLLANGVCLVPTFNDPADRLALGLLAELMPGREVVGVHCGDLVWGLGTIHCLTQQEPAGSLPV